MKDQLNIVAFVIVLSLLYCVFFLELFGPVFNPNLIIAFVLIYEMRNKIESSVMVAFYSGLVLDLFLNNNVLGLSSVFFIVVVYIVHYTKRFLIRARFINFFYIGAFHILYVLVFATSTPRNPWSLLVSAVMSVLSGFVLGHMFNKFNIFANSKSIKMNRL